MNIREHAPYIVIYIYDRDIDRGAAIKIALQEGKYDAYYFSDEKEMLTRIRVTPPHFIVAHIDDLESPFHEWIELILDISPEIQVVPIAQPSQTKRLFEYVSHGVIDTVVPHPESFREQILWAIDRATEVMVYRFQNEQLISELEKSKDRVESLSVTHQIQTRLSQRFIEYKSAESKEAIVATYFRQLPRSRMVYFRRLPSVQSFMVTGATGIDGQKYQGLGFKLTDRESIDLNSILARGGKPKMLVELMAQISPGLNFHVYPVFVMNEIEGLIAAFEVDSNLKIDEEEEFSLFTMAMSLFVLESKLNELTTTDPVTGSFKREYFLKKLQQEVERAERSQGHFCILKIAIDQYYEIEQLLGEAGRDEALIQLCQLVTKAGRGTDTIGRVSQKEIGVILFNTDRNGAILFAERVRRVAEGKLGALKSGRVTVSIGVSEYPSLAETAQDLDSTSNKALLHVQEKGGNRICLYRPADLDADPGKH